MTTIQLPHPIDIPATLRAIEKRRCELSLVEFIKAAWSHVEHRREYKHNWHIDLICAHLEAITDEVQIEDEDGELEYYNRLLINVPPGMMKSLLVNVFWPAWEWGPRNMPHIRTICASHSMTLSRRDGLKMRRLITGEWYKSHWGDRVILTTDQNEKTKFENTYGGFRQACAFENMTGARGDRVIIDDPHSVNSAKSDAERATTTETFEEAVPTRLDDPEKSAIVVIMQRLHEDDVSGVILDRELGYDHIMLPMRYEAARSYPTKLGWEDPREEDGELMFPDRFPLKTVDKLEAPGALGEWGTAGQHQQIPVPRGGGIIKPAWWQLWEGNEYPPMDYILMVLDGAFTEDQENDPCGLIVWGIFSQRTDTTATRITDRYGREIESLTGSHDGERLGPTPKAMMMYAWSDRLEFHALVQHTAKIGKRYGVDEILIENKANGHSVAQELRRLFHNEDFAVRLIDPKGRDKVSRLWAVQHIFEEKMVYAPEKEWAEAVIRQVSSFPKGKHDEYADCTSHGLESLRKRGFLTRAPERMKTIDDQSKFRGNTGNGPLYVT